MTKTEKGILFVVGIGILFFAGGSSGDYLSVLKMFVPKVEGFLSTPVWDYKQWSWGYGTAAGYDRNNKPAGSITRERAFAEMMAVFNSHYQALAPLVKKKLNANQWAALLSFSFNCGVGNAKNIVETINSGTVADVVARMQKYIYAGGVRNDGLVNRRKKETDLYQGIMSNTNTGRMMPEDELFLENRIPASQIGEYEY